MMKNMAFLKRALFLIAICLIFYVMYVIHCLHSFYSFDSLLQEESRAKIVHCSLDICSYEDESTVQIHTDSELFEQLFQALQSEQYIKPLTSILGSKVPAFQVEAYPFYRILLQHKDHHRTEVVVNGNFLFIGSTTGSGLTVYQTSDDNSLLKKLNALF